MGEMRPGSWTVNDVDYETVTDSVGNVIAAVVILIGVGGVVAR